MKINLSKLPWIIIGIMVIIMFIIPKACDNEPKVIYKDKIIKIPAQQGEFEKPTKTAEIPIVKPDTVYIKGATIVTQSPINKKLKEDLEKAKDSIEKIQILLDANRQRQYSNDFEDEFVKINSKVTVFGTLENNELKYELKEREVKVQEKTIIKNDPFGILLIGGYNYSLDPSLKSNVEAGAGVRINKVSVIGTINTQKQTGGKIIIEL